MQGKMKKILPEKTVVITGATSGIGIALVERLILETRFLFTLNICILCRNMQKGEAVRSAVKVADDTTKITLVKMDNSNIKSVIAAANLLKSIFTSIDHLYCNAGILPITGLNLSVLFYSLFDGSVLSLLRTGEGILQVTDSVTSENIRNVFATNVFSHFVLIEELKPLLTTKSKRSHIIWTTSMNAKKDYFSEKDLMCQDGTNPYGSSKQIINSLSIALNNKYNDRNMYSSLAEPGLCVSNINSGFLPGWLWSIVAFIFCLLRCVIPTLTVKPYYGAESLLWLFKQDPKMLNKRHQYNSKIGLFSSSYVDSNEIDISDVDAEKVYNKMKDFEAQFRKENEF